MKIVIVNESLSENLGDQLISYCSVKLLESLDDSIDVNCYDLTRITKGNVGKHSFKRIKSRKSKIKDFILRWAPKSLIWLITRLHKFKGVVIRDADFIFIGGGQIILGGNSFPISVLCWSVYSKVFFKKKVVIFNAGCSNHFTWYDKFLFKTSFKFVDNIFLRDERSCLNFKSVFGDSKDPVKTIDPVFFISDFIAKDNLKEKKAVFFPASYEHVYKRYNSKMSKNEYIKFWAQKIIENKNYFDDLIISSSDNSQDLNICHEIYNEICLEKKGKNIRLVMLGDKFEMSSLISSCDYIYSARMHPLIVALSYDVKKIEVFPISDKIVGFERLYIKDVIDAQGNIETLKREALDNYEYIVNNG
ncbi:MULTISPECIES: polysaccharide pyruvyl transferase family protein [Vibrio]|uniref:polysaccharide pyruvyl transferase family protein n=1 Tax=Vibrio TaxID=662 RepID=UPI0007B6D552|nr:MULTISPECIES: polysaccharide pyruvyl transferase family protein [Vibrio]ANB98328.1 Polysaccharide pyruvyl transferase [Vibrio parahaemolyticus]EHK9179878.1 polysaccharide pyruvyl transferase family protein [Vibrio parahaemolyticus]MCS0190523.1 polysaccharide pyruvyl transferase family protein [Vibrio parahaemolyticus]MCY9818339.1 polysaccharide pyruvyl transferase family protein [Vibrio alginolyticus]MDW1662527.1 polysaccharide pyruvyl transferase family protein [Vibrio sp. Vb2656]